MAALSAALYLSGIPIEQFGEGLQELYTIASKCLESPSTLRENWRSSSALSSISADSGYSRSLADEPITLLTLDLKEQKTLANLLQDMRNFEVWENAHSFLGIIEDIERRYYTREEEIKAAKESAKPGKNINELKIMYQGRDILNLLDNLKSKWKPQFAGLKDDQKELTDETKQIIDRLRGDKTPRHIMSKCYTDNCNYMEPQFY